MIAISIQCPFCGKEYTVEVELKDYWAWQMGELAQDAFPYLSVTERESLISQMCPECQDKIFGKVEGEEITEEDLGFAELLPEELGEEFDDYDDEVDACFIEYLANSRKRGM